MGGRAHDAIGTIGANQVPPKDAPERIWRMQGLWASSAAYQGFRDTFASLNLQTRLSLALPNVIIKPHFDPTYRALRKGPNHVSGPTLSGQHHSSEGDYQYSLLPPNSIRLLHLEPGQRDHPISCSLVVYGLDDLPSFEALSYTWGDVSAANIISCNGSFLKVHSNAWQALIDLRQQNDRKTLWIDAICINQQDSAEKSAQVQLMRHFYKRAHQVPIWIEPVTIDMALVFSVLSKLSSLQVSENPANRLDSLTAADLSSHDLPAVNDDVWKALDSFLWSSWFSRIWIIQEVSLAREAFLVSGTATCSWEDVKRAAHFIHSHSLTAIIDVDTSQVLRLESMIEAFGNGATILDLAQLARASKATDPRDKIYGLLGLASDAQGLDPNYSLNVQDSYTTLALQLIQQQQSLAVLNAVEHWGHYTTGQNMFHPKLPSWIPNWTLSGLTKPLPDKARLEQSALIYAVSHERLQLQVEGLEIGIIKDAGDTFLEFIPQVGNSVPEVSATKWVTESYQMKRWRQWECMASKVPVYPTGESVRSAYIRTLVADSLLQQPNDHHTLESIYNAWLRFWRIVGLERGRFFDYYNSDTSPEDTQHAISFMSAHTTASYGRRFFVTRKGYFGLGPFQTRNGDRVVALCGGTTPYVLRQDRGKGSLIEWKVLGECYLHGIQRDILLVNTDYQIFCLR